MKKRQKGVLIVLSSILGSLLGFGALSLLFDVDMDQELNKDYFKSSKEPLFVKKEKKP